MQISKTFVINLENRPDRWNNIQKKFNLELTRWNAVYGKNLAEAEIKQKTSTFCNIFCSYGMIGCWLSHYYLWQYIVDNNLDNVLVLEDDAEPVDGFDEKLDMLLKKVPENYDLVYLGCFGSCDDIGDDIVKVLFGKQNKKVFINRKESDEFMIPSLPLGTHAYIISYSGAKKLLKNKELKKVRYHVDYSLSKYIYPDKSFLMYACKKPLIMQENDVNTSDLLSNDHPILNYAMSKIKVSDNYNMDYIMSAHLVNIRRLNVNVTGYMILLCIFGFVFGLCGNKFAKGYLYFLTVLYCLELVLVKRININNVLFEIVLILMFIFFGNKLKTFVR